MFQGQALGFFGAAIPGWWFQSFLKFHPTTWGDDPIWRAYFSVAGWFNHQLDSYFHQTNAAFPKIGQPCQPWRPAAPQLPGSHCQVSRLSSAGIEKVGLGMGGILVASQLVSKAKKYRTWSFVFGLFFFGGGGRWKFQTFDFNFQGLFHKLFDKDPIHQPINRLVWDIFLKLLTWYHDSRVKTNPTEDTFFFCAVFLWWILSLQFKGTN